MTRYLIIMPAVLLAAAVALYAWAAYDFSHSAMWIDLE